MKRNNDRTKQDKTTTLQILRCDWSLLRYFSFKNMLVQIGLILSFFLIPPFYSIDNNGWTAFHIASKNNQNEVLEMLIEKSIEIFIEAFPCSKGKWKRFQL